MVKLLKIYGFSVDCLGRSQPDLGWESWISHKYFLCSRCVSALLPPNSNSKVKCRQVPHIGHWYNSLSLYWVVSAHCCILPSCPPHLVYWPDTCDQQVTGVQADMCGCTAGAGGRYHQQVGAASPALWSVVTQCTPLQYTACNALHCSALWSVVTQCTPLQYTACNALHCSALWSVVTQ